MVALIAQSTDQSAALAGEIQSLRDAVLLYGGIAAIAIFVSCIVLLWVALSTWRSLASLRAPAAVDLAPLRSDIAGLREMIRGLRDQVGVSLPAPEPVIVPESVAPAEDVKPPEPVAELSPTPVEMSFEELYSRLAAGEPGMPKPILVNFRDPEMLDRNPGETAPLVRDNNGTLMVLEHDGLPKGKYYLAPSTEFNGNFKETHTRLWRSLFDFPSATAMQFVKPAIVRADGNQWLLEQKGQFS